MTVEQLQKQIKDRISIYRDQLIAIKKRMDTLDQMPTVSEMVVEAELEAKIMELNSILRMLE